MNLSASFGLGSGVRIGGPPSSPAILGEFERAGNVNSLQGRLHPASILKAWPR